MNSLYSQSRFFRALGTSNTIYIFNTSNNICLDQAEKRVLELDERLSVFKSDSEISRINAAAGEKMVHISADTFHLLSLGKEFFNETDGAFSLTMNPLSRLWHFQPRSFSGNKIASGKIPDTIAIRAALAQTNCNDLLLDSTSQCAGLKQKGEALDLGGIAKGYAADEVIRILRENGIQQALINLGGTVFSLGQNADIGIQHPRKANGITMGTIQLRDQGLVTSGDYERCFIQNGIRYHHILDPRTGFPAENGLISVSLVGNCLTKLDALSTGVFVLGAEKGAALIKKFGISGIFVTNDFQVFCSETLTDHFQLKTKLDSDITEKVLYKQAI